MIDSTIERNVEFGEEAFFSITEETFKSTIMNVDGDSITNSNSFLYRSGAYKTIDYSEEKMMEAYRKVNRMLGAI